MYMIKMNKCTGNDKIMTTTSSCIPERQYSYIFTRFAVMVVIRTLFSPWLRLEPNHN